MTSAFSARLVCTGAVCALLWAGPVAALPAAGATPPAEVARRAESDPKAFGPLRLAMSESDVREKLGPPEAVSRRSMLMGSEEHTYTWDYPALGVTLYFSAFDESSSGTVMAIRARPPCDWTAVGGLRVGMSIEAASKILRRAAGASVLPIGSVGTEVAGLHYTLSDTAVIARLEMGVLSVLYVGPNLPYSL